MSNKQQYPTSSNLMSYISSGDSLPAYLDQIDKHENLPHDEQLNLIKEYVDTGRTNKKLRDKIVTSNMRFVIYIAKRYVGYGLPLIDLIQEGNVGILEALDKFEFDKRKQNSNFVTFAYHYVIKNILRYIEKNYALVRQPITNDKQKLFHNIKDYDNLFFKCERDKIKQISEDLGIEEHIVREVHDHLKTRKHVTSVTNLTVDESGEELDIYEILHDEKDDVEDIYLQAKNQEEYSLVVNYALSHLDARSRHIITARYLREEPESLRSIGLLYGIQAERVRQIEVKALKVVRKVIKESRKEF